MHKFFIVLFLFSFHSKNLIAQVTESNTELAASDLIFYGFDYTQFTFADPLSMDKEVDNIIFGWIGYQMDWLTEDRLQDLYKCPQLKSNFKPTIDVAKTIKRIDPIAAYSEKLDESKIQGMINNYNLTETSGVGISVVVECYDKKEKRISAYLVYFDVATKKIIRSDYFTSEDGNSYGRMTDWADAMLLFMRRYSAEFKKTI